MARVGSIELGGHGLGSGVAFYLSDPAPFSYTYTPEETAWSVEAREGGTMIVARTHEDLNRSSLLAQGLEHVQRTLDLWSFEKRQNLLVKRPGDNHLVVFLRDGKYVMQHVDVTALPMRLNVNVVIKDRDGNTIPDPPPSSPVWTPGLRFYRLSQSSADLFDAYRSLWLGMEAILDSICPKQPDERERQWLLRAISDVGNRMDLTPFAPTNCTNPAAYIVGTQYDYIRCRLFHAKNAPTTSVPNLPDPEKVAIAYERLIKLWRKIAERILGIHSGRSSAVTHIGFKKMLDNAFTNRLTMYFTDDPTPESKQDTEVSPLGHEVFPFAEVTYLSETAPGRVSYFGSQGVTDLETIPVIHRICSKLDEVLTITWSSEEGLYLDNVDVFESHQTTRLVNRDLPRVIFGD